MEIALVRGRAEAFSLGRTIGNRTGRSDDRLVHDREARFRQFQLDRNDLKNREGGLFLNECTERI